MTHPPAHKQVPVRRHTGDHSEQDHHTIALEMPVALVYKGVSHVVMMASPADLYDFGLGFSLSEGIIQSADDMGFMDVMDADQGLLVSMDIPEPAFREIADRRRHLAGRSGCGLCGVESLEEAVPKLTAVEADIQIAPTAIYAAFDDLHNHQPEKAATGAIHAAAWCRPDGAIALVREDVGRHNALDKLIGAMAKEGCDFAGGFCLITSRCSYEMVQKAVKVGIPVVAAISAPTAMAVDMAHDNNLTLAAYTREKTFTLFAHRHRIRNA